jgi:hypothetical protein
MTTIHRVTEDCQNRPEVALPRTAELIEVGPVLPGDASGYAHRVVLAKCGSGEYVTWVATYPDEDAPAFCYSGHYFWDIAEAAADYKFRVQRGF